MLASLYSQCIALYLQYSMSETPRITGVSNSSSAACIHHAYVTAGPLSSSCDCFCRKTKHCLLIIHIGSGANRSLIRETDQASSLVEAVDQHSSTPCAPFFCCRAARLLATDFQLACSPRAEAPNRALQIDSSHRD